MPTPLLDDNPLALAEVYGRGRMPARVNARHIFRACVWNVVITFGVSGDGALGQWERHETEELSRVRQQHHNHQRERGAAFATLSGRPASGNMSRERDVLT